MHYQILNQQVRKIHDFNDQYIASINNNNNKKKNLP